MDLKVEPKKAFKIWHGKRPITEAWRYFDVGKTHIVNNEFWRPNGKGVNLGSKIVNTNKVIVYQQNYLNQPTSQALQLWKHILVKVEFHWVTS